MATFRVDSMQRSRGTAELMRCDCGGRRLPIGAGVDAGSVGLLLLRILDHAGGLSHPSSGLAMLSRLFFNVGSSRWSYLCLEVSISKLIATLCSHESRRPTPAENTFD